MVRGGNRHHPLDRFQSSLAPKRTNSAQASAWSWSTFESAKRSGAPSRTIGRAALGLASFPLLLSDHPAPLIGAVRDDTMHERPQRPLSPVSSREDSHQPAIIRVPAVSLKLFWEKDLTDEPVRERSRPRGTRSPPRGRRMEAERGLRGGRRWAAAGGPRRSPDSPTVRGARRRTGRRHPRATTRCASLRNPRDC